MKTCTKCKQEKFLDLFIKNRNICKSCKAAYDKKHYENNMEKFRNRNSKNNPRKYGITAEQRDEMIAAQGNSCKICGEHINSVSDARIDHCHNSNVVRGILCNHCNLMLGHAKDSVNILKNAIQYLNNQ